MPYHQINVSNRPFNFTPSYIDSIYRIFPSGSFSKNILQIWRFRHCTGIILLACIILRPGIIFFSLAFFTPAFFTLCYP